jgi:MFS family permease
MIVWGIVVTLMGVVQNYHGLLVARLFLGIAEAGLYPGVTYYLTMWYCTNEIQWVSRELIDIMFGPRLCLVETRAVFQRSINGWGLLWVTCLRHREHGWRWGTSRLEVDVSLMVAEEGLC